MLRLALYKPAVTSLLLSFVVFAYQLYDSRYCETPTIRITGVHSKPFPVQIQWATGSSFNDFEMERIYLGNFVKLDDTVHQVTISVIPTDGFDTVRLATLTMNGKESLKSKQKLGDSPRQDDPPMQVITDDSPFVFTGRFTELAATFYLGPDTAHANVTIDGHSYIVYLQCSFRKLSKINFQKFIPGHAQNFTYLPHKALQNLRISALSSDHTSQIREIALTGMGDPRPLAISTQSPVLIDTKDIPLKYTFAKIPLVISILLSCLTFALIFEILRYAARISASPDRSRELKRALVFLGPFATLCLTHATLLLAQWPGYVRYDIYWSWHNIRSLSLSDEHSYGYTLLLGAIMQIWQSPAALAFAQMLFVNSIVSFALAWARLNGLSFYLYITCLAIFTASVPLAVFNITIANDVAMAALLMIFILVGYSWKRKDSTNWQPRLAQKVYLGVALFFLSVVRHEGLIYLALVPFFLTVFGCWHYRRAIMQFSVIALICVVLYKTALASFLNVTYKSVAYGVVINPIAALFANPAHGYYTTNASIDKQTIEAHLMPVEALRNQYHPGRVESVLSRVNKSTTDFKPIVELFFSRIPTNLDIFLTDRFHAFLDALALSRSTLVVYDYNFSLAPRQNFQGHYAVYDIACEPILVSFADPSVKLLEWTQHFWQRYFIWANVWSLCFLLLILFLYKYVPSSAAGAALVLTRMPILFLLCPPHWRYYYFLYLGALVLLPLSLLELTQAVTKYRNTTWPHFRRDKNV